MYYYLTFIKKEQNYCISHVTEKGWAQIIALLLLNNKIDLKILLYVFY